MVFYNLNGALNWFTNIITTGFYSVISYSDPHQNWFPFRKEFNMLW